MKAFTVFMPVYNTEAYLNEAIESVLKQDYKDFDFLIIDDGSATIRRRLRSIIN